MRGLAASSERAELEFTLSPRLATDRDLRVRSGAADEAEDSVILPATRTRSRPARSGDGRPALPPRVLNDSYELWHPGAAQVRTMTHGRGVA